MELHQPSRLARIVLLLSAVYFLFGIGTALFSSFESPQALLRKTDWERHEGFFADPLAISRLEAPRSIRKSPELVTWRSWSPDTGGTKGELRSIPFDLPIYMAIPYVGFPGEVPGTRVVLQCVSDGREIPVASLRTNTQWATIYLETAGLCSGKARLIASAAKPEHYVGVATPFAVSKGMHDAHTQFPLRGLVIICTWALMLALAIAFGVSLRVVPTARQPIARGFVGVGLIGMVTLAAFTVSRLVGLGTVLALTLLAVARLIMLGKTRLHSLAADWGPASLLWLGVSLTYGAFASAADSGGGSWAINGLFSPLRWSSDNQLPMLLTEGLVDGTPRTQLTWFPWLATDRSPLLSTLLAYPRIILAPLGALFGSSVLSLVYMSAGITILTSWTLLIPWFCREAGIARVWIVAVLCLATPFALFNTIYIWPKILGATYVVIAFLLLYGLAKGREDPAVITLVALSAALSVLSHGSNLFALLPLAFVFFRSIWSAGYLRMGAAAVLACVAYAPWAYWQKVVQPGGNALVRYAFARDFGFDQRTRPILESVRDAYDRIGWAGWLDAKLAAAKMLIGAGVSWADLAEFAQHGPGIGTLGTARVLDFFVVLRSIGVPLIGVGLAVLALGLRRRWLATPNRLLLTAAACGLAGIVLQTLLTLPVAWTHHQAYGAILLIVLAGAGAIAASGIRVALALTALAVLYVMIVWVVAPLAVADRLVFSSLAGMGLGLLISAAAIASEQRLIVRPSVHASTDPSKCRSYT